VQEVMSGFFGVLQQNAEGVSVLIFLLASVVVIALIATQWLSWIRGWGRYRPNAGDPGAPAAKEPSSIAHLLVRFLATIISEFRHLLALLIFLLFAGVLSYSVYVASQAPGDTAAMIENIGAVVQAVVASLGGLVGSIIGYYFGESSARARQDGPPATSVAPGVQMPPAEAAASVADGVRAAAPPPQ
jgi:hypothetical protein